MDHFFCYVIAVLFATIFSFPAKGQEFNIDFVQSNGRAAYFYTSPSNELKAKGRVNFKNKKIGRWQYFDKNGNLIGVAFFSKKGDKRGKWLYYNSVHQLEKIVKIRKRRSIILLSNGTRTNVATDEIEEPIILPSLP